MASGFVETRKSSISRSANDFSMPLIPLAPAVEMQQKGELSRFVLYISYLLNDDDSRQLTYLALIFIASFPAFIDSVSFHDSVFNPQQTGVFQFCDDFTGCVIGLSSLTPIYISLYMLYYTINHRTSSASAAHKCSYFAVALLVIGNILLMVSVMYTTLIDTSPNRNYRTCFQMLRDDDQNAKSKRRWCRVSYFGNNCLCIGIGWLCVFDIVCFKKIQNNLLFRMKAFAVLLVVSSFCIESNLIANGRSYVKQEKFTLLAYVVCCIGYAIIIIVCVSCFVLGRLPWDYKQTIGQVMSMSMFFAVLCVQTRMFADLFVFNIVCLIMAVDIQVLKEQ